MWRLIALNLCVWTAQQTAPSVEVRNDAKPEFTVASIKITSDRMSFRNTGGPQTTSPGRWTCSSVEMQWLVKKAWNLGRFQLAEDPALTKDFYDITAILPSDTSQETFRLMLQNLLKSRFNLVVHFEKRPMTTYVLSIGPGSQAENSGGCPGEYNPKSGVC